MKPYIEQFTKAVYGANAELALASFNQQKFLEDATSKIAALEAENAKLREVVEAAKNASLYIKDLSSYDDDWMHWLSEALKKLEAME